MSVEVLWQAAGKIREDWYLGPLCPDECGCDGLDPDYHCQARFHLAVADWLDRTAAMVDELASLGMPMTDVDPWALSTAAAYMDGER